MNSNSLHHTVYNFCLQTLLLLIECVQSFMIILCVNFMQTWKRILKFRDFCETKQRFCIDGETHGLVQSINTYHAAGVSRRQLQNVDNILKDFNIVEFLGYIWNHHEKCFQRSTNMLSIGVVICGITLNKNYFAW